METREEPAGNVTLDDLLAAIVEEARRGRQASAAYDAAYESMPAWAKAGPRFLMGDGTVSEITGWPQVEVLPAPPSGIVMRLIRPSIRDVWRHSTVMLGPPTSFYVLGDGTVAKRPHSEADRASRRRTRLAAFIAVRKVIARVRLQREERRKAGLVELSAAKEASIVRLDEIEKRIRAMATGISPTDLAADALMENRYLGSPRYSLEQQDQAECWIRETLLARLAPALTGLLRVLVDDFVHGDGSRVYEDTLIGGGLPPGVDAIDLAGRAHVEGIAA